MRSYDGAKICELVGLYLLNRLTIVTDKSSVGLCRNDRLAAINDANSPKFDRIRKDILWIIQRRRTFNHHQNKSYLIETDFLDVTFNHATKKHFPFRKANNTRLNVNTFSNPSPTIIKQLSKIINKRISDLSCNKEELDKVKSVFELAVKDSGHILSITCNNSNTQNARSNRNRKLYGSTHHIVKICKHNIGTLFIMLVSKHFPKEQQIP